MKNVIKIYVHKTITESTFLDALFIHISENGNVDQETIKLVIEFMKRHQYDTDSFRNDLSSINNNQTNMYNICNENIDFMAASKQFITNIDCMFYIVLDNI